MNRACLLFVASLGVFAAGCLGTPEEEAGTSRDAVVGGTTVPRGEQPWAGFLERAKSRSASPVKSLCGVSLIDATHAVTAAHCIASPANPGLLDYPVLSVVFPQMSSVRTFVKEVRLDARFRVYPANATLTNEEANARFVSDVAVLTLESAPTTNQASFAALASDLDDDIPTEGVDDAFVIGFGRTVAGAYDRTGAAASGYGGTTVGRRTAQLAYAQQGAYVTRAVDEKPSALCVGDSGSGLYRTRNGKDRVLGLYYGSSQSEARKAKAPGACEPDDAERWSFFVPVSAASVAEIASKGQRFPATPTSTPSK